MSDDGRTSSGPMARFFADYVDRHRYWPNALLHVVGIPLMFVAACMAWRGRWGWAVGALVGGYVLQSVGHRLQGSEVGEMALIRRVLGRRRSTESR